MDKPINIEDTRKLLMLAINGIGATEAQCDQILEQLKVMDKQDDNVAHLVEIITLSVQPTAERLAVFESFLSFESSDWALYGAISGLCNDWELTAQYIDFLIELCDYSHWDEFSYTISSVISCNGHLTKYFHNNPYDKNILKMVEMYDYYRAKDVQNDDLSGDVYIGYLYEVFYCYQYGLNIPRSMLIDGVYIDHYDPKVIDFVRDNVERGPQ